MLGKVGRAALIANGLRKTERGYQYIDKRLNALGAKIEM
jgi:UDP-N-acetylglucosamine enolpyruvyl transferase